MNRTPDVLIAAEDVTKNFLLRQGIVSRLRGQAQLAVHALSGISFTLNRGETLGVVGESGCGKSTLARCLVRLLDCDEGRVLFEGEDIAKLSGPARSVFNRRVQMIFQDPYSSLNPRMTVRQVLAEALSVHKMRPRAQIPARIAELLEIVRLSPDAAHRFPHEFSGGQRQRIGIARALAVEPEVLVADELVSALDVSVQAQVVNLLLQLQEQLQLTVVFVAHDLRLVRHISHRVAVMYLGRIVELGPTEALFSAPRHPYTKALLDAAPELDPKHRSTAVAARGELPSPINLPKGCAFNTRCPVAFERCFAERPQLADRVPGHQSACHLSDFGRPDVAIPQSTLQSSP